ncbi:amino acid adenylation domain-containing protein, partial [Nisaea sp.]
YAAWQRDWLSGEVLETQLAYWRDRLGDAPALMELPADHPRPAVKTYRGGQRALTLEPELAERLEAFSRARGATLFMTLLAAFKVLLHRYSGQEDILVGSPIANRTQAESEELVGFFVNTLVMRSTIERAQSFETVLSDTRETALDAYAHQDLPFETLVTELQPERSLSHSPLFQVMFALQNAPQEALALGEATIQPLAPDLETAKFDLTLSIDAGPNGLSCNWEYAADLFEPARIDRMAAHYRELLESILAAPEAPVGSLPLLTRDERHEIADWSGGESLYPRDASLAALFGEMVASTPDAVALHSGDETLTYAELDERSDRLAAYVVAQYQPVRGAVIGLCLPRGADLIVAMLATLKTGAAYLPLDPDLPQDRLGYMLEEAEVALVLTREALADVLPKAGHASLLLDRDANQIAACHADVPAPQSDGGSLAYVMYTSGSTGRPKGVMVPQRAVTRLVRNTDYIDIKPGDRIAQAATPVFDAATFEIWGALLNGAAIELLERDDILDPDRFAKMLRDGRFNTMFLTATLFNRMAQIDPSLFAKLDTLLVGGEALDPRWIRAVLEAEPPTRLLNGYGPTECTTFAVCHHITEVPEDATSIPIGNPIANTNAHILDPDGTPVPTGIAGELHLGGDGLADGYLAQPALTEERFVTHPTLGRLYRTGDLCRWNQSGAIDYLGRTDHQIKLRGFRIELGEIEAALRAIDAVEEVVTLLAGEAEHRRIVAYATGTGLDSATLRREMQAALPSYMVPSEVVVLDALPLTVTGKLDRRALPIPEMALERTGSGAPVTPGEELLAGLWADVLKTGAVGRSDSFFDLGGHSLLATQLLSRIRAAFGTDIPLRLIFEHPTLSAQAAAIEAERRGTPPPPILPRQDRDALPLSFAQQRLWFLAELEPDNPFYNTPLALRLTGKLDKAALKQAIDQLVARHEVLRTAFRNEHGEPIQVILDHLDVPLQEIDLTAMPEDAREAAMLTEAERAARAPFTDLGAPPLLRAELVIMGPEEHVLLLTVHHIIIDGWSLNILTRELAHAYLAHLHGAPKILPPLPVQYADFAAWQRDWLRGDVLEQQLSYWRQQLADAPPMLSLPTDRPRPAVQSFRGASLRFTIDAVTRDRLKELSRTHNATLFMTLLTGFATLLYRYSGQDDIVIGSPIANRTNAQSEDLVGFFVNTLALRVRLSGHSDIPSLLDQIRQTALDAYAHQDLPFEHLVDELQPDRDLSRNPVFQVMMALQNMPLEQSDVEGLQLSPVHIDRRAALFDLVLDFWDVDDGLQGVIEYNRDLFDHQTVERMVGHFTVLLQTIAETPERTIDALPLMGMDERTAVLALSNGPDIVHPVAQSLAEAFESQVSASPDRVAAEAHRIRIDYAELNRRANRLAHFLIGLDVAPGDPVAILVPRGLDYLTGVLGIIKAGGMFLPLDTAYPGARLHHMLEDSGAAILVADGDDLAALSEDGLPETVRDVVLVGGNTTLEESPVGVRVHMPSALSAQSDENPPVVNGPRDPLYLLYTSGSTGRPKGALVRHEGALNHIFAEFRLLDFGTDGAILQSAPASSDISVWQCLGPLLVGGRVVFADFETVASPRALLSLIRESRVSLIELVPVVLESLMNEVDNLPEDRRALPDLTSAMVTGEAVSVALVNRWLSLWPDISLINAYGPTEAADDVCQSVIDTPLPAEQVMVPIGMPVDNMSTLILDTSLALQPIGVPGEICVSGIGVGDGYWRRPELTAEVFVDNPHSDGTFGKRLYRTGDLGRWRPDGTLEYLGRIDGQVKIRGFRVELGEIEAAIARNAQIREVLVQDYLDPEGERRLAAYLQVRMPSAEASDLVQDQVALWKELHEASYADESVAEEDATFNTIGWDSTFTGEPLSTEEMRECVDNAISRILELDPRHLLEIGCGTGLLLYRLVPECESYLGTDLSSVAIEQLKVRQNRLLVERLSEAALRAQTADDFQGIAAGSFDTLVLNSVIQYFPSHDYLLAVLREAVERCADGGAIFVGDVRSLPLLRGYHGAVQCFKAESDLTSADLSERIEDHLAREQELAVAPAFFDMLRRELPRIAGVEIRPKRGAVHNEMTCFRYDVVIHVGAKEVAPPPIDWEDWRTDRPGMDEIRNRLATADGYLAFRNIPNARLDEMRALLDWLDEADTGDKVEAARTRMQAATGQGLDPEALWSLQETLPVTAEIFWEPESDCGALAVLFRPTGHAPIDGAWSSLTGQEETPSSLPSDDPFFGLTNNPLSESFTRHLLPRLRQDLRDSLPEHMIPSGFVVLDRFPLMPNGKVDRQALPAPRMQTLASGTGSAPTTATETAMQEIWAEVLGIAPPGTEKNFFELGGHSLKATQVLSRLQDRLRKELTLRDIFSNPTISALSELLDQQVDVDATPIAKVPDEADYPVSYAQQRLWFLSQMDGGEAYHMVDSLRVRGLLDVESLRFALGSVVARHESLRTSFFERDGVLRQRVEEPGEVPLDLVDLSDATDPLEAARQRALTDAGQGFDLTRAPLIRLHLLQLGADDHVLLFNMHHIVSDGWSMDVLVREVIALYRARTENINANLPSLPIQHRDYVAWQSERLSERAEQHREFWRTQLGDLPPPLDLPTDFPRPPVKTYSGGKLRKTLDAGTLDALNDLARAHGTSLFMVLTALVKIFLHRISGAEDISLGVPAAGRGHIDLENQIGFFVNTLVLRDRMSGAESFTDILDRVRRTSIAAYAHEDYPFDEIVRDLNVPRDPSRNPLFDVMVAFQNTENVAFDLPGLEVSSLSLDYGTTQFDQLWSFTETDTGLQMELRFNRDLFEEASIARQLECWVTLVENALETPEGSIGRLPLLSSDEQSALLSRATPDVTVKPAYQSLTKWFEAQAAASPDAIAVSDGETQLSYVELNSEANRLAHRLGTLMDIPDGGPSPLIGLCLPRSPELIVAMLAILKAGGAYLPLDPNAPAARLEFILKDAQAPVLITRSEFASLAEEGSCALCLLDEAYTHDTEEDSNPDLPQNPDRAAYVIYTSGSTGQPKGTVITHTNAMRLFTATDHWFGFGPEDVWTLFHSFAFDFSVWECWGALLHGGRLVIVPFDVSRAPDRFLKLLERERVTVLNQTPSAFRQLLQADPEQATPLALRYVIFGGEALDPTMLRPWFERRGDSTPQLVNMYGITETTVHVTYRPLSASDAERPASLIGEPIPDLQLYVLNDALEPVPDGIPGELLVGGAGLALGYLERPDLTAERFIDNPVRPGERLYRTGDKVRRRNDGELEYLGRLDSQVKMRGFRIELGEISACLNQHEDVREAAVIIHERDGDKSLVGYYVPQGAAHDAEDLRRHLQAQLPAYMVPSRFIALEHLPLTINGKLDHRALPAPETISVDQAGRAPGSELEEQILSIWHELLGHPGLGVEQNVFEHGAHSVLAVRARARIQTLLGREVSIVLLFQHPTPAALAAALEASAETSGKAKAASDGTDRAAKRRGAARGRKTPRARGKQQGAQT